MKKSLRKPRGFPKLTHIPELDFAKKQCDFPGIDTLGHYRNYVLIEVRRRLMPPNKKKQK